MFKTVPDRAVGAPFTEQMWDEYIRDNLNMGVVRPIAETILGADTATIDFTSIAADHMHLLLVVHARTTAAATSGDMLVRFNNDATAIYDRQLIQGIGGTASAAEGLAQTSGSIGSFPGGTAAANRFGGAMFFIPHYANAVHHKTGIAFGGRFTSTTTGTGVSSCRMTHWRSTAAINRITLFPTANDWLAATCATLYGMGGL